MKRMHSLPVVYPVACHTDQVGPGTTFVAIKGHDRDGLSYISLALDKGATTIVVAYDAIISDHLQKRIDCEGITLVRVNDTRQALAQLSAKAADNPADKLTIIGITGTKGKTTTAWLLYEMLSAAGYQTALMSGVYNKIKNMEFDSSLTTAQPDYIHQFLRLCVLHGVTHVVMEVAAQAYSLFRIDGLLFDGVIFTNFGYEHLEFYSSLDDYFFAKKGIITHLKTDGVLCLNCDDERVIQVKDSNRFIKTYGLSQKADYAGILRDDDHGLEFLVNHDGKCWVMHCPQLMGVYNVYNILAALTMARELHIDTAAIADALLSFQGVPGRFERYVLPRDIHVVIDYAHTPDSYKAVLSTLRNQTHHLVVIFGAGGKRDRSKRPIMGSIAASYADEIILTSDNPRTEDPLAIVQDILAGIDEQSRDSVTINLDREQAILDACAKAPSGATIVLLGKGNDEYQMIGTKKIYFSEREIVQRMT